VAQTIDQFMKTGPETSGNTFLGMKGIGFTPGEQGYPRIVAPGYRPSIGTSGTSAGLSSDITSYWSTISKNANRTFFDVMRDSLAYANPTAMRNSAINETSDLAGKGIAEKFYGMSDKALIDLAKNPELKPSIVLSRIPEMIGEEKVANIFSDGSVAGGAKNAIQTTKNVVPDVVVPVPEYFKFKDAELPFVGSGRITPEQMARQEQFHDFFQDVVKGMKQIGVADEDLPAGAEQFLNSPRTAEYEDAVKRYLINHPNEKARKTAEQVKDLKILGRNEIVDYPDNPKTLAIAYKLNPDDKIRYAKKSGVDELIAPPNAGAKLSTSVPFVPPKALKESMEKAERTVAARVASNAVPQSIEEGVSVAVRRSGATGRLLNAASQASSAVAAGTSNSAALRGAGAALSILRGVI